MASDREPLFGAHMSVVGGYERAVYAAHDLGFKCVQLFTKNNSQWRAPALSSEQIKAFRSAVAATEMGPRVSHASYLINLASPDENLWKKSIDAMIVEVERCASLEIEDLIVHPGAHMGAGEEFGLRRISAALDEIIRRVGVHGVKIDLETTAGQGSSLGHRFEHLRDVVALVEHSELLGICVDTCHIFAAGYSLDPPVRYDETISSLEQTVGIEKVRLWHLNDSCREAGSRVDRHAGIGGGQMGLDAFRNVLNDIRFRGLPMILETPKGRENGEEFDSRNLRILRSLVQ